MSKEQQAQAQPQVAIPLPKAKKNLVQIGCICMMLSVAMYGLVFATLTAPILEKVDAMGYVGLFSIVGAIGVSSPVFTDVVFFVSDSVSVSVSVLVMVTCASVFASLSVTEVLST